MVQPHTPTQDDALQKNFLILYNHKLLHLMKNNLLHTITHACTEQF